MIANFTKIAVCLNPNDSTSSVLDASANIAKVFGAEIVALGTAEDLQKHKPTLEKHYNVKSSTIAMDKYNDDEIIKIVKENGFDLLVEKADKTSQKVVNALEFPVLTLNTEFSNNEIKDIVMPLHDDEGTRQKIPVATQIAKRFGATIHIIGVSSSNKEELAKIRSYVNQAEKLIEKENVKSSSYMAIDKKVNEETIEYATKINAEMIIIMNDRDGGGFFGKSLSEKMILASNIPVMIVEPKTTTVSWSGL